MTDDRTDDQAVADFRAWAAAMGVDDDTANDLIEQARAAAGSGGLSLADALAEEEAELAVHLGREG